MEEEVGNIEELQGGIERAIHRAGNGIGLRACDQHGLDLGKDLVPRRVDAAQEDIAPTVWLNHSIGARSPDELRCTEQGEIPTDGHRVADVVPLGPRRSGSGGESAVVQRQVRRRLERPDTAVSQAIAEGLAASIDEAAGSGLHATGRADDDLHAVDRHRPTKLVSRHRPCREIQTRLHPACRGRGPSEDISRAGIGCLAGCANDQILATAVEGLAKLIPIHPAGEGQKHLGRESGLHIGSHILRLKIQAVDRDGSRGRSAPGCAHEQVGRIQMDRGAKATANCPRDGRGVGRPNASHFPEEGNGRHDYPAARRPGGRIRTVDIHRRATERACYSADGFHLQSPLAVHPMIEIGGTHILGGEAGIPARRAHDQIVPVERHTGAKLVIRLEARGFDLGLQCPLRIAWVTARDLRVDEDRAALPVFGSPEHGGCAHDGDTASQLRPVERGRRAHESRIRRPTRSPLAEVVKSAQDRRVVPDDVKSIADDRRRGAEADRRILEHHGTVGTLEFVRSERNAQGCSSGVIEGRRAHPGRCGRCTDQDPAAGLAEQVGVTSKQCDVCAKADRSRDLSGAGNADGLGQTHDLHVPTGIIRLVEIIDRRLRPARRTDRDRRADDIHA